MSGLKVRISGTLIAVAAMLLGVNAGAAPVVPVNDYTGAAESAAAVSPLQSAARASALAMAEGDVLSAPITAQTSTAVIPLPPGVVFGLVGLASAAIARRRYLKRH